MRVRRGAFVPLLALLFMLALAEGGVRWFVLGNRAVSWRPLPPFGRSAVQTAWLERTERELAQEKPPPGYSTFDPTLGWTTRRGYASADGRVHVNARGLRAAREYEEERPAGKRRVVVCGESFTFCEEVSDAEAWPARVEALSPELEVWNFGVGGYGTDQAFLRVSREARAPVDALLVGLMLENIGRNVNRYRPLWYPAAQPAAKPRYLPGPGGLELLPQPFATLEEFAAAVRSGEVLARLAEHEHWRDPAWLARLEWSGLARLIAAREAYAARALDPLWRDTEGEPFRTTLALLDAFRALARTLGNARLAVLVFPTREILQDRLAGGERSWSTLLVALDELGIETLDLSVPLAEAARTGPGVDAFYGESHFSPRGNDLVAAAVRTWLVERLDLER